MPRSMLRVTATVLICALLLAMATGCVRAKPERAREPLPTLPPVEDAALDEITRADTPTGVDDVDFQFSDDLWANILYDLALAARGDSMEMDHMIAALVPIYFARVASLVIEAREMTTQQAESLVERQARAYEQAKPDFVERWRAGVGLSRTRSAKRGAKPTAAPRTKAAAAGRKPTKGSAGTAPSNSRKKA
ncbi:MAG: hypothetical protein R6X16_15595 [Anaerolineae bacterium]